MAAFKAVSKNVMDSNLQITDKVYSNLKANELRNKIQALGESVENEAGEKEVIELLEMAAKIFKKNSN